MTHSPTGEEGDPEGTDSDLITSGKDSFQTESRNSSYIFLPFFFECVDS